MNKKYFIFFAVLFLNFCCYGFDCTLIGNAHIFSYNDFKIIYENPSTKNFSANELYKWYDNLRKSCGNNELLFDEKLKTDFANSVIKISGRVKQVRKSILDEYIVELETTESWAWDINVVYPENISQSMKSELMKLRQGDYFEALAITRNSYMYVDVPVWNQNGVYRTEP